MQFDVSRKVLRYDKAFVKQELYARIPQAEKDIDEGKGRDAFEALDEIRAELGV